MIGIEMVVDKTDRKPLTDLAPQLNRTIPRYLRRKHGVLLGIRNSTIIITPPLVITAQQVDTVCKSLINAFDQIMPKKFDFPMF